MTEPIANSLHGALNSTNEATLGGYKEYRLSVMEAVKLQMNASNVENDRILLRDIPFPDASFDPTTLEELGQIFSNFAARVGSHVDEFLKPNQFKFRETMIMLPELVRLELAVKKAQSFPKEATLNDIRADVDLRRCIEFLEDRKTKYGITDEIYRELFPEGITPPLLPPPAPKGI